ncbi:MAG TPA: META domain-containing protein [Chitinophagaceae bacterium]|jgi:heat shock protein HslJ|nr:META domain-containing protein [Chitinophagaceae bacterium]
MKYLLFSLILVAGMHCSPKLSPDAGWGNQRWVVVEMKGVPVQQSGGRKDAFINFNVNEKRFNGNAGCNQMSGNYTIDNGNIHFGEVLSTKMSCADIEFETAFLSTLGNVDRYEMEGNDLFLKRKKEIVLKLKSRQNNIPD